MSTSNAALARPLPEWVAKELYPFAPRALETPEGTMRYLDEGAREGATVLIVHGTPSWSFEWRAVVRALARSHRVVVPDHLGFGLSDKPDAPDILRPADHARRLVALADALDLRDVVLVVHDFGGPIGLPLALDRPERVRAIVAINTWMWAHGGDARIRWMSRLVGSPIGRLLYRGMNASPRWIVPSAFGDRRALTAEAHRQYLAPFATWSDRAAPWTLGVELAGSDPYYASLWDRRAALARLPLHVAWGMRDPAFGPTYLARWREAFPEATVHELDVGHFPAEECPARVAEIVASAGAGSERPPRLAQETSAQRG